MVSNSVAVKAADHRQKAEYVAEAYMRDELASSVVILIIPRPQGTARRAPDDEYDPTI